MVDAVGVWVYRIPAQGTSSLCCSSVLVTVTLLLAQTLKPYGRDYQGVPRQRKFKCVLILSRLAFAWESYRCLRIAGSAFSPSWKCEPRKHKLCGSFHVELSGCMCWKQACCVCTLTTAIRHACGTMLLIKAARSIDSRVRPASRARVANGSFVSSGFCGNWFAEFVDTKQPLYPSSDCEKDVRGGVKMPWCACMVGREGC